MINDGFERCWERERKWVKENIEGQHAFCPKDKLIFHITPQSFEADFGKFNGHPILGFHEDEHPIMECSQRSQGVFPTQCLSPCRKREHTHGGRPTDLSLPSLWSWRSSDDSFCINLFLTGNSQLIFCFFGEFSWRWKGNCFNTGPGMSKNWKLSCQFDWCIISSWQSPSEHFQHSGVRPRQQRARLFSHAWYVCVDQMQHHLSRPVDAVQHSHFQVFGSSWASLLATICDLWIVSPQKWEDLVE